MRDAEGLQMEDVAPKRFGLNFNPPSIIVEYLQTSTGKLFHRRIGLRKLRAGCDAAHVAEKLRQKNAALLGEDRVPFDQIVSLVRRLQDHTAERAQTVSAALAGGCSADALASPCSVASVESSCVSPG
ncbi:unnamed protein product, partial [Prorocentrum cordatum]